MHNYAAAGQYIVTLVASINGIAQPPVQKTISIIDVTAVELNMINCFGDKNGAAAASVIPSGNYAYQWNTVPAQNTQTALGLGAGTYTVQVSGTNVCPISASVTLTQPSKLQHQTSFTNAVCTSPSGTATVLETGGAAPYSYNWSPSGGTSASEQNLSAGNYIVSITDDNGCVDTVHFIIQSINPLHISLGNDTLVCPGEKLLLYPGRFSSYVWQDNSADTAFNVVKTGKYNVRVMDANGCTAQAQINVTVDCSDIYFPNAITPNDDGLNDSFGAIGNVPIVKNFKLQVFSRWGNVVFETTNPYQHWNGKENCRTINTNAFVWLATYTLRGKSRTQKGTVLLLH